jgi:hypothetical protein
MAMKNKSGIMVGFVLGLTGFLLLFKLILLDHIPPEDEIPPVVVVITALVNGLLFAFAGRFIQGYFERVGN